MHLVGKTEARDAASPSPSPSPSPSSLNGEAEADNYIGYGAMEGGDRVFCGEHRCNTFEAANKWKRGCNKGSKCRNW
ncbi:conserved hypothetical protein [Ricinus communis]|uniref:Uncharacterized protein n=1 Tax=Ricinus communis TaxID=3988 RepID=B9RUI8_RICCO|nr:conserved hypothetical protein [Ricinus communis]